MPKTEMLSIDLLRLDGGTQARIKISEETVEAYAELIDAGKAWPFGPVDVFHDGSDYFVADGFHRTLAAQRLNRASVPCIVHKGTAKDAKIFGMTANDKHGLRMSRADKRACVEWLLDNGPKMTQADIAQKSGVSVETVKRVVASRKPEKVSLTLSASETQGKSSETDSTPATDETETTSITDKNDSEDTHFDAPEAPPEAPQASIMLDSLGIQIPKALAQSSELAILLQSTGRELDKYRKIAKEFADQPGGEWLRLQNIDDYVRSLKNQFQDARYHTVCPRCGGNGKDCKKCNGVGWLPDYLKGTI